jgi:hypothetical protein
MKKIYMHLLASAFVLTLACANISAYYTSSYSESGKYFMAPEFVQTFEDDVFGFFMISGKAPKEFADIDHLDLGGNGEYGAGANPPYYGQIRLKDKKKTDFKLLKPTLKGKNLSFKTQAVKGISYEFTGTLTQTDFSTPELQPEATEKVLSGTLRKMKAGKMIAESKVEFTWFLGD